MASYKVHTWGTEDRGPNFRDVTTWEWFDEFDSIEPARCNFDKTVEWAKRAWERDWERGGYRRREAERETIHVTLWKVGDDEPIEWFDYGIDSREEQ